MLLLSSGRESRERKESNTGIRHVAYLRNVIPILWGLNANSKGRMACCAVPVMRGKALMAAEAVFQMKGSAAERFAVVMPTQAGC